MSICGVAININMKKDSNLKYVPYDDKNYIPYCYKLTLSKGDEAYVYVGSRSSYLQLVNPKEFLNKEYNTSSSKVKEMLDSGEWEETREIMATFETSREGAMECCNEERVLIKEAKEEYGYRCLNVMGGANPLVHTHEWSERVSKRSREAREELNKKITLKAKKPNGKFMDLGEHDINSCERLFNIPGGLFYKLESGYVKIVTKGRGGDILKSFDHDTLLYAINEESKPSMEALMKAEEVVYNRSKVRKIRVVLMGGRGKTLKGNYVELSNKTGLHRDIIKGIFDENGPRLYTICSIRKNSNVAFPIGTILINEDKNPKPSVLESTLRNVACGKFGLTKGFTLVEESPSGTKNEYEFYGSTPNEDAYEEVGLPLQVLANIKKGIPYVTSGSKTVSRNTQPRGTIYYARGEYRPTQEAMEEVKEKRHSIMAFLKLMIVTRKNGKDVKTYREFSRNGEVYKMGISRVILGECVRNGYYRKLNDSKKGVGLKRFDLIYTIGRDNSLEGDALDAIFKEREEAIKSYEAMLKRKEEHTSKTYYTLRLEYIDGKVEDVVVRDNKEMLDTYGVRRTNVCKGRVFVVTSSSKRTKLPLYTMVYTTKGYPQDITSNEAIEEARKYRDYKKSYRDLKGVAASSKNAHKPNSAYATMDIVVTSPSGKESTHKDYVLGKVAAKVVESGGVYEVGNKSKFMPWEKGSTIKKL